MRRRIQRQIRGILEGNSLRWIDEDSAFLLRFDSALVHVGLGEWGEQTLIQLRSDVLTHVAVDARSAILEELNRLNCQGSFCRWAYYEDDRVIGIEYDLLADHLQEAELMTALAAVARLADGHDDTLQLKFGGRKAFE